MNELTCGMIENTPGNNHAPSLTPALSRWERGNPSPLPVHSTRSGSTQRIHTKAKGGPLYPSPSGRGIKGEGERADIFKRILFNSSLLAVLLFTFALPLFAADKKAEPKKEDAGWISLFDGKTLKGWKETEFAGRAGIEVKDGSMVLGMGDPLCGVNFTNEFPKMNYEISLEGQRVTGADFFCGLTFPVGTNCCTYVLGGWGGAVVGISSINDQDASENDTTKYMKFEKDKWYQIRLRVTPNKIEAWVDNDKMADVDTTEVKLGMRPGEIELSQPIGIASFLTSSAFRNIKYKKLGK